jgi:hypothetical protein
MSVLPFTNMSLDKLCYLSFQSNGFFFFSYHLMKSVLLLNSFFRTYVIVLADITNAAYEISNSSTF